MPYVHVAGSSCCLVMRLTGSSSLAALTSQQPILSSPPKSKIRSGPLRARTASAEPATAAVTACGGAGCNTATPVFLSVGGTCGTFETLNPKP